MNERLKDFLDTKKDAEKKVYEARKNKVLLELGLFEKIYSEEEKYSKEFPESEYDNENSKTRWYKKEPISISDEEYELVKKYSTSSESHNSKVSTCLMLIAILVYLAGFILGCVLGVDRWGDPTAMMLVYWLVAFATGTVYLGLAEIIDLLTEIKNK